MITQERVRHLFNYLPDAGQLIRLVRTSNRVHIGDDAGSASHRGYRKVHVDGKRYYEHCVIWLWMTGEWPRDQIDHIDMDASNNRWGNLREASQTENNANTHIHIDNTSGVKGVYFDKERNLWAAQLHIHRKHIFLGRFNSRNAAHEAYKDGARRYFGDFCRVTNGLSQRQKETRT
jgi:hypothetical protein